MHSIGEYLSVARDIYKNRGVGGVFRAGKAHLTEITLRQARPLLENDSDYVLDEEWDVLLIMDACRVDALEEVADEYEFLPNPPHDKIWSADSYSKGWLEGNFTGKQALKHRKRMKNLIHVSGNPFTDAVFDGDEFHTLDEVWRYGWDEENGYMPPGPITDRAITHYREEEPDQMIVHYMQPHAPFISDEFESGWEMNLSSFGDVSESGSSRTPWELLRDGIISQDELWEAYLDTLRVGLDSVETLLHSIDAESVIISADHGNAMGEWGIYDHPRQIPLACVREVPWVKTSATDTGEYSPKDKSHYEKDFVWEDSDREEQLKDLGYM